MRLIKRFWLLITLLVLLFGGLYFLKFHGSLSSNSSVWGDSANYFSFVTTLVLTLVVIRLQIKRDHWEMRFTELQMTASLIWVPYNKEYWKLYNMGKGTANKIIIGKEEENLEIVSPTYHAYSIPSGGYLKVDWADAAEILYALYEDDTHSIRLAVCKGDENYHMADGVQKTRIMKFIRENATRKEKLQLFVGS